MKNIGITANIYADGVLPALKRVLAWCRKNKVGYSLDSTLGKLTGTKDNLTYKNLLWKRNNLLVSLGGDGTLLSAAQAVGRNQIPILGINLGGLGFLTQLNVSDIESGLSQIKQGKYELEERLALEVQKTRPPVNRVYYALNDAVLHKAEVAHLIAFEIWIGKEFICSFLADGLIVSTPTGSTAYSLAAGGPIIHPHMEAMIAIPICPQTITTRPIIFSASEKLTIKLGKTRTSPQLMLDGQMAFPVRTKEELLIQAARHKVNLVKFPNSSFYAVLRQKLHWGLLPGTKS